MISVGPFLSLSPLFIITITTTTTDIMPILGLGNSWIFSQLTLNLINKEIASSIFPSRETGTNCPGASCKLSLKDCQKCAPVTPISGWVP